MHCRPCTDDSCMTHWLTLAQMTLAQMAPAWLTLTQMTLAQPTLGQVTLAQLTLAQMTLAQLCFQEIRCVFLCFRGCSKVPTRAPSYMLFSGESEDETPQWHALSNNVEDSSCKLDEHAHFSNAPLIKVAGHSMCPQSYSILAPHRTPSGA